MRIVIRNSTEQATPAGSESDIQKRKKQMSKGASTPVTRVESCQLVLNRPAPQTRAPDEVSPPPDNVHHELLRWAR